MRSIPAVMAIAIALLLLAPVARLPREGMAVPETVQTPAAPAAAALPQPSSAIVSAGDAVIENLGQAGCPEIRFYSAAAEVAFAGDAVYVMTDGQDGLATTVRLAFDGANAIEPAGADEAPWKTSYILGSDPARWLSGVGSFGSVEYAGLWDGIDLACRVEGGALKYDFRLAPYADPGKIRISAEGQDSICIGADGALLMELGCGAVLTDSAPVAYYADGAGEPVEAVFALSGGTYSFTVADRDPARPLIIDPYLYSTLLGGNGGDSADAVAGGVDGSAYVAGSTDSLEFVLAPGTQEKEPGDNKDIFVSKLSPSGDALEYQAFIGGSGHDVANAAACGPDGGAYIAGVTYSEDFPTTMNALNRTYGGVGDAFVVKLSPDGAEPEYSTFLGGAHDEEATGIAVDADGQAFVTGYTWSADFPTTEDANRTELAGDSDAFVAKLNAWGDLLIYSTFIGGAGSDRGAGIALLDGCAYIAGTTRSLSFPATNGSLNTSGIGDDLFAAKLDRLGRTVVYAARFGGNGSDIAAGIAVDGQGRAYMAATTRSTDILATAGAAGRPPGEDLDTIVACLDQYGASLLYLARLGGSGMDTASGIAVDAAGNAQVAGTTASDDFPATRDALQSRAGGTDAFLAKLAPGGSLLYSTPIGGSEDDSAAAMALDAADCVLVAGETLSADFPATEGAFDTEAGGGADAFACRLDIIKPVASAGPDIMVNESNTVVFDGSASWDNHGIASYTWSLYDGEGYFNLTGGSPSHFFRVPGSYNVTLTVTDEAGNSDSDLANITILVYPIPVADAGPDISIDEGSPAVFNGSASRDNEGVARYSWEFGDGLNRNITLDGAGPEWLFTVPGSYNVTLTVWDADWNTDTDGMVVTVEDTEPPVAVPGPSLAVGPGTSVSLDASSSADNVGIENYTWTFSANGTEVSLYGPAPNYTFWSEGTTEVTLNVTDASGNAAQNVLTVTVAGEGEGADIGPVTITGAALVAASLVALALAFRSGRGKGGRGKSPGRDGSGGGG